MAHVLTVSFSSDPIQEASVSAESTRLPVNQQQLKPSWDCSTVTSKGEWIEWIKKLGNDLMRESPCQAIRASRSLAEVHQPFAKELFNVAFVSCWTELYENYQEDLTKNLESALSNTIVPPDVINIILGLAEFMEHDEKGLAIEARVLGDYVSAMSTVNPTELITIGHRFPRIRQSSALQRAGILYRCLGRGRRRSYQH
jgi:FKBP12-rapamycin complex-associated protein